MKPLESTPSVPSNPSFTVGPIPEDEDNTADLIDIGRSTAETEIRDAVSGLYVDEAYDGDDTEEALADLARAEADEDLATEIEPETGALHLEN